MPRRGAGGSPSWPIGTTRRTPCRSAGLHEEVRPPVLGPAPFAVLGAGGPLLAVGDDRDAIRLHALADQVVHRRLRAPLAERQVVFVGAADDGGAPVGGGAEAAVVAGRFGHPARKRERTSTGTTSSALPRRCAM